MSKSAFVNWQQGVQQHHRDGAEDACCSQPMLSSLGLDPKGDSAPAVAPKLTLRKRSSEQFSAKACNSAFFEGLFEDIANTTCGVEQPETEVSEPLSAHPESSPRPIASSSVTIDRNLPKRRRVSTTKSLGRCGQSCAKLSSHTELAPCVTKKSSVLISVKALLAKVAVKRDLPATVSNCYSFQMDLAVPEQNLKKNGEINQQEDFGWFVDTDDQNEVGFQGLSPDHGANSSVPLAFSAPTAPRASIKDQAEAEWAQAADTVDEVLGDFF